MAFDTTVKPLTTNETLRFFRCETRTEDICALRKEQLYLRGFSADRLDYDEHGFDMRHSPLGLCIEVQAAGV